MVAATSMNTGSSFPNGTGGNLDLTIGSEKGRVGTTEGSWSAQGTGKNPARDWDPGGGLRSQNPDSGDGGGRAWFLALRRWSDGREVWGGVVLVRAEEDGGGSDSVSDLGGGLRILTGDSGGGGGAFWVPRSGMGSGGLAVGMAGGDMAAVASGGGDERRRAGGGGGDGRQRSGGGGEALRGGGGWRVGKEEGGGGLGMGSWVDWALGLVVGPYEKEESWAWMESFRGDDGLTIKASHRDGTLARLRE